MQQRIVGDRARQPAVDLGDGVIDRERGRRPVAGDAFEDPVAAVALASATFEAATMSGPLVWWRAGSSRSR
ncbi:MAG: hypothetical protein ABIZ72_09605, partial [Candidatus Limnocylindrales bacterium]